MSSIQHFTSEILESTLPMSKLVDYVEEALKELSRRECSMPVRTRLSSGETDVLVMPAHSKHFNLSAVKIVTVNTISKALGLSTIKGIVAAIDPRTGEILGTFDASTITGLRTGAASAVATKYLARRDSHVVAIIGAGFQARFQLEGIICVRNVEEVRVCSRSFDSAARFSKYASERFEIDTKPVGSVEEAVRGADVIVTATTSPTPVLRRSWIGDGTHINAIGSYKPNERELDTETVVTSSVYVDHKESAMEEAGDLIIPIKEGRMRWEDVKGEIGEVAMGLKAGRTSEDEVTVFKSVGVAVEDVAAVAAFLKIRGLL